MNVGAKTIRVLIGYASRFGSTRDIANRIADAVRTDGSDVDVRSVDQISDFDHYDAMVFGSGVYDGSWTAEATELMRRHVAVLAHKPVWLFSVGSFGQFEHTLHRRFERRTDLPICDEESTMKIALRVIGVLLLLMGPIWFLQGANVLTVGSSPMIGDTRWEFYGGLATLIGAALLAFSWRKTSSSRL